MGDINLYYFLYPFVGIISIIGIYINKEKLFFKIISVFLIIISMCRFDTGYDYFWYWIVGDKSLADNSIVNKMYQSLEFGIQKVYDITRFLGHSQYFFAITGFITFILLYKTLKKNSRFSIISLIFFLFAPMGFYDFNHIVMQATAVSIIFYFTRLSYAKKYFKFILIVLFACLFHSSAVLCLVFLFIPREKIDKKLWVLGIIGLFIVLKYIFPFLILRIHPRYYYLLFYKPELLSANLFNLKIFTVLFFIIVFLELFRKKINLNLFNKNFNLKGYEIYQFNIFGIGIILSLMLAFVYKGDLSRRIGMYFLVYGFLVAGNYIDVINKKIQKYIKIIVIFVVILAKIFLMIKWEQPFILNQKPCINEKGNFDARPNSIGLRLFFDKKYEDMIPYLPGETKFERDN